MSKIICDVCGTAYSDTAAQCPICGTAKNDKAKTFSTGAEDAAASGSYVKGGRFSHSNVRRRNAGKDLPVVKPAPAKEEPQPKPAAEKPQPAPEKPAPAPVPVAPQPVKETPVRKQPEAKKQPEPKKENAPRPNRDRSEDKKKERRKSNLVLIFLVIILLLSIIFICTYIADRYLQNWGKDPTEPSNTNPSITESTGPIEGVRIPCSSIVLPGETMTVSSAEGPQKFVLQIFPETCTDKVSIVSSDESILSIDERGMMTIHASGEVTITVVCGDQTAECMVIAVLVEPTEPTDPTTPPTEPPTEPPMILTLAYTDITLRGYEATWKIYSGEIDPSLITFTSSNPEIVEVNEKGVVKVLDNGIATITAEYEGQTKECIVRCKDVVKTTHKLNYTDVTIVVGERFTLQLIDGNTGAPIQDLTWSVSMEGYVELTPNSAATGLRVKGLEATGTGIYYVTVSTEYEGVTYSCKVRVKAAPAE